MTKELENILGDFNAAFKNWDNRVVTNEEEFINSLRELSKSLTDELKKPQIPEVKV